jgi:16S rRNA (uracil1498-N3)-methyltransferase
MTRRRWIADEVSGNHAALTGDHARHLTQVLRAQVGQEFDISTGKEVRRGRISGVTADRVEFELGVAVAQSAEAAITVALSILKFDRMEWAIEKCTELGVVRIIPFIAARTEPHLVAAAPKRVERWRRIAHQAAEQSRRVSPPEISAPLKFDDMVAMTADSRIILAEAEEELLLKDAVRQDTGSMILAFGPEGGWKPQEIAAFRDRGWTSASLGDKILRAETAVIAAVAIASSILGGFERVRPLAVP